MPHICGDWGTFTQGVVGNSSRSATGVEAFGGAMGWDQRLGANPTRTFYLESYVLLKLLRKLVMVYFPFGSTDTIRRFPWHC